MHRQVIAEDEALEAELLAQHLLQPVGRIAGRLRIEKFILEEPEIQIIKNEAGLLNLAALAAAREKKTSPRDDAKTAPAREKAAVPRL